MTARRAIGWTLRGLLALLVLFVLAGAGIYLWLRTSLPQTSGTLSLAGLTANVTMTRDAHDIPHIRAANIHDAVFALGFVQAEDRLFQMDLLRRYGEGRISEIGGKNTLNLDRFMRTIGLDRSAQLQLDELSKPVRDVLDAYAAGVNAYIAHRTAGAQPYYLVVPGPAPWRPVDTLVIGQIMSFYLAQNYRREIEHARLAARLTPAELQTLYPNYPKDGFVTLAQLQPIYRRLPLDRLAALLPRLSAQPNASNNWVVDGRHSVTGKPILENDPHLTYTAPAIWYLAQVDAPGLHLTGGFIPGEPFMVVGHNDKIGWGFTETGGDVEDLFIEKLDPTHPGHYLAPQGSLPFETRHETIHVKGAADVALTVRSTRHGPVISDVSAGAKEVAPSGGYVLSLEATFLRPGDRTPQALWDMNEAQSWDDFKKALRDFGAPQMNIVYADTGGTIGFFAPALIPIRKKGDGWLPAPGWTGDYDWIGYIPFDRLPHAVDPPQGRFISANNKIVPDSYPYFITRDWALPYRADRIAERLDQQTQQSLGSTGAIVADTVSLMAKRFLPNLLRAPPADQRSASAEQMLRGWNDDMKADEPAPLIFIAWLRETERELFARPLGAAFQDYWHFHPHAVEAALQEGAPWCGTATAKDPPDCATLLSHALQIALGDLAKRYGGDMASWRWGQAHPADFRNPVLSRVPLASWLFGLSVPAGGGGFTVNAGDMNISAKDHPYHDIIGPGLRMILDFADLSKSRFLMAPGVSEDPLSPHYGDLMGGWRDFHWMVVDNAKAVATLTLRPH